MVIFYKLSKVIMKVHNLFIPIFHCILFLINSQNTSTHMIHLKYNSIIIYMIIIGLCS